MENSQKPGHDDFSAEDDPETQVAISDAANSEFKRLVEKLKKQEEEAKTLGDSGPKQPLP